MKKQITLLVLCINCAFIFGQEKKSVADRNIFDNVGSFSAKTQFIVMAREGSSNQTAASQAITFNYESPKNSPLTLGFQLVTGRRLMGTIEDAKGLNTSNFSTLNHFYLKYNFEDFGLSESHLTIGRQRLNTHFSQLYEIRHKEQAFEGVVLRINDFKNAKIQLGSVYKFSLWKSFGGGFEDIDDIDPHFKRTKNFQFLDVKFSLGTTNIGLYNLYGKYAFNIFGLNVDYQLSKNERFKTSLDVRYVAQTPVENSLIESSKAFQLGVRLKAKQFSLHSGFFNVTEGGMKSPFQPSLIIEEPMYEADFGFMEGSYSFFTEASYSYKNESLYFLYLLSKNENDYNGEINIVYGHSFKNGWYAKLKTAFVNSYSSQSVADYRIFIGYNF